MSSELPEKLVVVVLEGILLEKHKEVVVESRRQGYEVRMQDQEVGELQMPFVRQSSSNRTKVNIQKENPVQKVSSSAPHIGKDSLRKTPEEMAEKQPG